MRKLKMNKGWIIIILLSILPIIFWSFSKQNYPSLISLQNIAPSLGEVFGLVGIVMFALNFILVARIPFINHLFNGLNNVYQKHSLLGQIAFILLLFHPLLLIPRYSTNLQEAASFLSLGSSWARNFGLIALGIMIVLIILTLYLRPKYKLWKITHKFFGLALFLGALHVYFIPAYIMNNPVLKIYVLTLAILGIIAFLYRSIFGRFIIKTHKYVVKKINKLNDDTIEIVLRPLENRLLFKAGQFIFISFRQRGIAPESHPFSISSGPDEELLRITVKRLGKYTTRLVNGLFEGALAKIEGPYGTFSYYDCQNKKQIWVAGGVGITPFVSFVKDLIKNKDYSISLFYCVRSRTEAIYLDLFKKANTKLDNFSINLFYSDEKGYINADYIQRQAEVLSQSEIFLCAPPRMIQELRRDLIDIGINRDHLHSEEFNF